MKKLFGYLILLLLVFGGGMIASQSDTANWKLDFSLPKLGSAKTSRPGATSESIKIATFNIQVFGQKKVNDPSVLPTLVQVARKFDVLAIQEIRSHEQDVLPKYVAAINAEGAAYDYVISFRLGRTNSKEQYAFVYNTNTIELDRESVYVVEDPQDLLHREPFVAGFRARGAPPERAFTFTLVNIHTDPDEVAREVDSLADVYQAVREDGRGEDDIIVLGDLNADDRHLGRLAQLPYMGWAIAGIPSNTRGTALYDNLVFQKLATREYTGNSGVFNLREEYSLSQAQAELVSDHYPVWAEFSVYEGDARDQVAGRVREATP